MFMFVLTLTFTWGQEGGNDIHAGVTKTRNGQRSHISIRRVLGIWSMLGLGFRGRVGMNMSVKCHSWLLYRQAYRLGSSNEHLPLRGVLLASGFTMSPVKRRLPNCSLIFSYIYIFALLNPAPKPNLLHIPNT